MDGGKMGREGRGGEQFRLEEKFINFEGKLQGQNATNLERCCQPRTSMSPAQHRQMTDKQHGGKWYSLWQLSKFNFD
jgi:hypothetical protein